jgi:hypothetical protein
MVFVVEFKVSRGIVPFSPFGEVHWTVRKPQLQEFTNALRKNLVSMAKCGINFFDFHVSFFTCKSRYDCCTRL